MLDMGILLSRAAALVTHVSVLRHGSADLQLARVESGPALSVAGADSVTWPLGVIRVCDI